MDFEAERERMVREQIEARGVRDRRVLEVMRTVPRHLFVEDALQDRAYDDTPLPIGWQQTISQPYIVALMAEMLELEGGERLLEVGTGSGYEAVVLGKLCAAVYSVERIPALAERAIGLMRWLGSRNVSVRVGDGSEGWLEQAPFDGVVLSAAARHIPRPLVAQLAVGGRLVLPMGEKASQTLVRVRKTARGLSEECFGECRFVKLVGTYGWDDTH